MTFYLVKHSDDDYRLHESDGAVIDNWTERPDKGPDGSKEKLAAVLSNPSRMVTEGYNYRDMTRDAETVPWI